MRGDSAPMTRRTVTAANPDCPAEPAGSVPTEPGMSAEALFERVCSKVGIRWEPIAVGASRTADYWIHLSDTETANQFAGWIEVT
jgi:hypothetical protein